MSDAEIKFQKLFSITSLKGISEEFKINCIGKLIDYSADFKKVEGIYKAFELAKTVDPETLNPHNRIIYHYDIANGWNAIRKINRIQKPEDWDFEQEELNNEIIHLRKAISIPEFHSIPKERRCQIYTNLGNCFNYIGRYIESQETWHKAIKLIPHFSMALLNIGNGYFFYAGELYDTGHKLIFLFNAYKYTKVALEFSQYLEGGIKGEIEKFAEYMKSLLPDDIDKCQPEMNIFSEGDSEQEKKYRKWCLNQVLFLNPLNDIGSFNIANIDNIVLPNILMRINEMPVYHSLFNQIKQEFVTARYFYYEALTQYSTHFSDKGVKLLSTNDLCGFSFNLEKLKISYRMLYSIFDKIAFLLNDYLKIGIDTKKVSFKTIWLDNKKLRPIFLNRNNWSLRGLYWLSKDLFEANADYTSVIDPDAQQLATIRNYLEHKGIKIRQYKIKDSILFPSDPVSLTISRKDLENKTMKLLKMVREAIIYLALSINQEEANKDKTNKHIIHSIPLDVIDDRIKV